RVSSLQPPPTTELYTLSHTTLFRSGQLEPAAYPAGAPPGHDAAGSHPAGGIANRGRAGLLRQSPGSPDLAGRRGRKRAAVAAEAAGPPAADSPGRSGHRRPAAAGDAVPPATPPDHGRPAADRRSPRPGRQPHRSGAAGQRRRAAGHELQGLVAGSLLPAPVRRAGLSD